MEQIFLFGMFYNHHMILNIIIEHMLQGMFCKADACIFYYINCNIADILFLNYLSCLQNYM